MLLNYFKKYLIVSLMLMTLSCGKQGKSESAISGSKINSSRDVDPMKEYMAVINELHEFECSYMTKAGNQKKYTSSYDFRSDAFQEILRDINRANLTEYESINYLLADIGHRLSDKQKNIASEEMEKVYKKGCNEK